VDIFDSLGSALIKLKILKSISRIQNQPVNFKMFA